MSSSQPQSSGSMQPNMDWMYKPSALVNRDDYLLGRSVDKSFNLLEAAERTGDFNYAEEVEKDLTPLSIFAPTRSGPVDVINKIKEDPLYQIQKKEEENLKQLLKNPVRMKQMREITEQQERQRRLSASSSNKSKTKQSKHKRHRRDSDSSTSSSSSDEDSKTLDVSKVKSFVDIDKLISQKLERLKKMEADSGSDSSDDNNSKKKTSSKHSRTSSDRKQTTGHNYRDRNDSYRHHQKEHHSRHDHEREREAPRRPRHHSDRRRSRSRSRSRDRERRRERRSPIPVPVPAKPTSSSTGSRPIRAQPSIPPKRVPLDEAELERRRQEMMSNATWRDEQRTKSVNKYREEEKKEEERHNSGHNPDFIRKQLLESANTGSVEKRIKSNSYNIQKSYSAMNQNFARR